MAVDWQVGDLIQERWEIHRIMQGGMGIVYVVYDREWREAFAAKTFQDQVFARNPNTKERFEKEASAWINLDLHENITEARFLQVIGGKPFLFLEYVSGGDMSRWIGTPRLTHDLPQVLRFGIQFCDGMRHVISKGIEAHRDIKPQNCLVTENGVIKVTDFGLAKIFDDAIGPGKGDAATGHLTTGLSQTWTAVGTCTHMAPEQFVDSKHVDVRADIYSFGVMLFQMVVGDLPFVGRDFKVFATLHATRTAPLHKIPNRRLRSVVERCLLKKPKDRYESFDGLRGDLAALYEAETGQRAPEPVTGEELTAFHFVNKGGSLRALRRTDDSLACCDKAISLNPSLAEAWHNKGTALTDKGRNAEAIGCYERALALRPTFEEAWTNKGQLLSRLGRFDESLLCFDRALAINPRNANAWFGKGRVLAEVEKHHDAVTCYGKAVEIDPKDEKAWFNMGHSMGLLGRHEDVIKCCDCALAIIPHDSQIWLLKGLGFYSMKRFQDAIPCFQQAERLGDASAASHINNCRSLLRQEAETWFERGSDFQQAGNIAEAIRCYDAGLAIEASSADVWNNKGAALLALNRGQDAIACFDRAIALNPRDSHAWNNKGYALYFMSQFAAALPILEEAQRLGATRCGSMIAVCRDKLGKR